MRALPPWIVFVLCCTLATPTHAQLTAPSGVRAGDNALVDETHRRASTVQDGTSGRSAGEISGRALLGVGGAFFGAVTGAYIGANIPHGPCGCDDPGLKEVVTGGMVGSVLVGAVLASTPQFSSSCHPVRRIAYGVIGAATGAAAGGVLGASVGGIGVLIGYITGAGVGGGIASGVC